MMITVTYITSITVLLYNVNGQTVIYRGGDQTKLVHAGAYKT